jgi:hypothetical protein
MSELDEENVVNIARGKQRPPGPEFLRIRIDSDGALVLRLPGGPRFAIAPELAESTMERLLVALRRARYRRLGIEMKRPPETGRAAPEPQPRGARSGAQDDR